MIAAAVEVNDLGFKRRHIGLALHGVAPDVDLAVLGHSRDGFARGRDIHDGLALQPRRNLGERGGFILVAGVGHRAVGHQGDILVIRQRDLGDLALILAADLDIGHVAVAPEVEIAVRADDGGELVARFELHHVPIRAAGLHGLLHVIGEFILLKARVAPDVDLAVRVHRDDVIRTGGNLHQIGALDLVRDVRHVDFIGDAGVSPRIQLALVVNADAIGVAGGYVLHAVIQQRLRHLHHVA